MPTCKKCGHQFPLTQVIDGKLRVFTTRKYCLKCSPFGLHNTRQLEVQSQAEERRCRICAVTYWSGRGQYADTCQSCRVTLKRRGIKKLAVEQLGGQCLLCGYSLCLSVLQFHHLDPGEKDFTIADKTKDWPRVQDELKKCVLLCATCHGEVHAGLWDLGAPPTMAEVWARRMGIALSD